MDAIFGYSKIIEIEPKIYVVLNLDLKDRCTNFLRLKFKSESLKQGIDILLEDVLIRDGTNMVETLGVISKFKDLTMLDI